MAKAKSPSRGSAAPGAFRRWTVRVLKIGGVLALLMTIGIGIAVAVAVSSLPSFEELRRSPQGQTIRVHDVSGGTIVAIGPNYGRWMPLAQTPQAMQTAMVAVEDRRFRYHFGIDPVGLVRSISVVIARRGAGRWQGASTITQQLARTVFLSNSYTFSRKLQEAILAMALEWKFSKDQLLELYLNKVYFGGGSYGIDAASRTFFGHGAERLSLPEAAIIAGLVKAPSAYSPTADARAAIGRANVVLDVMVDAGVITPGERAAARPASVRLAAEPAQNSARYFTDWALPQLATLIDESVEPLDVWTTLDLDMQSAATSAIQANTPGGAQGALVSLDRDGAVRAMVGGRDYVTSNYNRATVAQRQPGSAWKLFVYLAALEAGYHVNDAIVDEPITINGWTPRNSSGRFSGRIDIRTAFAYSVNTVAARLGDTIGTSSIAAMARRFGITTPINTEPSSVLGTSNVRLIEMASAFAAVSAGGHSVRAYGISRVTTAEGRVLYERRAEAPTVLVDNWVAAGMTDLLQTAVNTGTGRAAQIGRPVAGKTGTTSDNKDGWFLGFSSGITTGVWMGRDDNRRVAGLQGGTAPARAFAAYMRTAVANRPAETFNTDVQLPQWQLEDDNAAYMPDPGSDPAAQGDDPAIDSGGPNDGVTIEDEAGGSTPPSEPRKPRLDQSWIDETTGRRGGNRDNGGGP